METPDLFKKKFFILQEISSALVVSDNIGSLANLMLGLAVNYTSAEKGSLMLLNDHDELYILAAKGIDQRFVKDYRGKVGEGIAGTVARSRRPVLVEDIDTDTRFQGKARNHYRTKSFISCPLVSKDRLLGVLNINDKQDGTLFSLDEFELLTIIANHAAIALENASLLAQLRSKAAELEEINWKLIETNIGKTEFLTRISHELRTPLNSVKGAIYHLQEAGRLPKSKQREFQTIIASEIDQLIAIVEHLLNFLRLEDETRLMRKTVIKLGTLFTTLTGAPSLNFLLADRGISLHLSRTEEISDVVGDTATALQLFTNLIAGVSRYLEHGDTISLSAQEADAVNVNVVLPRAMPDVVLSFLNETRDLMQAGHTEDQLKLSFARSAAGLHRWSLLAENTDHCCRIVLTIPKSAREKVDAFVSKSMDSFVEFIAELLDLDICSIMLSDELTNELIVKSARGLDDDIIKRTRIKFGDKIAGWVALEGKPLFVENIESDPRFSKKSIPQYSTKSFMSLPLKIDERVVGVLNLNNKKTFEPFTLSDYYLASLVSERISHFMKLIYTDASSKDEFPKFLTALNRLLDEGQAGRRPPDRPSPSADHVVANTHRPISSG